jgi:hypothetical protein
MSQLKRLLVAAFAVTAATTLVARTQDQTAPRYATSDTGSDGCESTPDRDVLQTTRLVLEDRIGLRELSNDSSFVITSEGSIETGEAQGSQSALAT